jgi:archaeal type IV pilus assembly protein PilA
MMKKMWKMRKDKSAVSPVIATILMVAITVVLAAVLYVMVMGFGGTQTSTPTGSFTVGSVGTTTAVVSFGQVSPVVKYTDCKFTITKVATSALESSAAMTAAAGVTGASFAGQTIVYTAAGLNPSANGQISVGDSLNLGVLTTGTQYKVTLLYIPTGGQIATQTFTTN